MARQKRELLYQKIEKYIVEKIENETFKYNEKIPSEMDLCKLFGASRMTVNKALTNLSNSGYIERIPGKGSFVRAFQVEKKIPEMISFSEELQRAGMSPSSKLLHYSIIKAGDCREIAKKILAGPEEMLHYFVRLRCGDGKVLAVSYNYVRVEIVPMLDINCLQESFYRYLEDSLRLSLGYNDTTIQVVTPSEEIRKLLHLKEDMEAVKSSHVSFLTNNTPFEYTETFYNPKQYKFSYRCYRK